MHFFFMKHKGAEWAHEMYIKDPDEDDEEDEGENKADKWVQ